MTIQPDNLKLLNEEQLREVLQLSRSSVYRLLRCGALPKPVRVGLRTRRWNLNDVEQWLRERAGATEVQP